MSTLFAVVVVLAAFLWAVLGSLVAMFLVICWVAGQMDDDQ